MLKVSVDWAGLAGTLGKNFAANKGLRNAAIGAAGGAAAGALGSKDGNRFSGAIKGGLLGGAAGAGASLTNPSVIKSFTSAAKGVEGSAAKAVESTPVRSFGGIATRRKITLPRGNAAPASSTIPRPMPMKPVQTPGTKSGLATVAPKDYIDAKIVSPVNSFKATGRRTVMPSSSTPRPMPSSFKPSPTLSTNSAVATIPTATKQPIPLNNVVAPKAFTAQSTPTLAMKSPKILPLPKSDHGQPIIAPKAPSEIASPQLKERPQLLNPTSATADRHNYEGSPNVDRFHPNINPNRQLLRQPEEAPKGIISGFLSKLLNR